MSKNIFEPTSEELNQLVILFTNHNLEEAENAAHSLINRFPSHGFAWKVLGAVLQKLDRLDESLAAKRKAVDLLPFDAEVHSNLGNALFQANLFSESEISCQKALELNSLLVNAHYQLGLIFQKQSRLIEAELKFLELLKINPKFIEGYYQLGNVLTEQKKLAEAEDSYRKALTIKPDYVEALYNLGATLHEQDKLAEAEACYLQIMQIQPNFANTLCNLATILEKQWKFTDAVACYRRVLDITPNSPNIHLNIGSILGGQGQLVDAKAAIENALLSSPKHYYALAQYSHVKRSLCDWDAIYEEDKQLLEFIKEQQPSVVIPFTLLATPIFCASALRWAANLSALFRYKKQMGTESYVKKTRQKNKLRIGYLSADFYSHATVYLMAGILENRNTDIFDVYLYSYGYEIKDTSRSRVENACEVFRHVCAMSDESIAKQIADDEIDILVDLKGYTQNSRIGIQALRPAPIIVSWLGYPGTLGHERLADYIIGDATVTPPEHADHFSETLALMPHCYQPNDNSRSIGECPTRTKMGLPENGFVFCTFNQAYKITPEIFDVWCRLLLCVPNSVLWLLEPHPAAQENLRHEMASRGIESSRLIFAAKMEQTAHLGRLQLADLAVDTFPYTSHTTASDALWAGVPLVTKMGETFASRVAASILKTMDLDELTTTNDEDYFHVALELAQNSEKLAAIKAKIQIQKQISPLFDTQKFARDLEQLYQTIWEQELKGERKIVNLNNSSVEIKNKKIGIIQFDNRSDKDLSYLHLLITRNQQYAAKHGYNHFFIRQIPINVSVYWIKVYLIKQYLKQGFDAILWLDTDAVIHDFEQKLENFLDGDMTISPNLPIWGQTESYMNDFNAGAFFCSKNSIDIIDDWWNLYNANDWFQDDNGKWKCSIDSDDSEYAGIAYEQGAFAHYLLPKFKNRIKIINDCKVLQAPFPMKNTFICHFAAAFRSNYIAYLAMVI